MPVRQAASAETLQERHVPYAATFRLLGGLLRFELSGTVHERIDWARGRYEVSILGAGDNVENDIRSAGILRGTRWTPLTTHMRFSFWGRIYRSDTTFDHEHRRVQYSSRGESFFLRHERRADDRSRCPRSYTWMTWPARP